MKKKDAFALTDFVAKHDDFVSQEDWFEFSGMVLDLVIEEANRRGYAAELAEKYPWMFRVAS